MLTQHSGDTQAALYKARGAAGKNRALPSDAACAPCQNGIVTGSYHGLIAPTGPSRSFSRAARAPRLLLSDSTQPLPACPVLKQHLTCTRAAFQASVCTHTAHLVRQRNVGARSAAAPGLTAAVKGQLKVQD